MGEAYRDERIAVGDPQYRVTVWLGHAPEAVRDVVHVYGGEAVDRLPL